MQVTQPATATTGATAPATTRAAAAQTINPDFDTFLKMLTTQMQNQDPLNPMDSSEYAVQLATFSGVEQQTKTNELLGSLLGQIGAMGMAQLSGWVGMEARSTAPVGFAGSPVTLAPTPDPAADRAVLVVKDATGTEVARGEVPLTAGPMDWAGTDADGNPLPNGQYSFSLESYQNGALLGTNPVESYARITEARSTPDGTMLVLAGGAEVPVDQITALRAPG